MAEPLGFRGKRRLFDVTVTRVSPGATHLTAVSGQQSDASGVSDLTRIGGVPALESTALHGRFGDLTDLIVISPVDADGSYPDVTIWPVVDNVDLRHVIMLDASVERNMMPNPSITIGQRHVALGIPYREAVDKGISNRALKCTGLKASVQYRFAVYSASGFGNNGAPVTPLRIIGIGDLLNEDALREIAAAGYDGSFSDQVPGFAPFSGVHQLKEATLTPSSWTSLPGGPNQGVVKIFRFFREAVNRVATPANGLFRLTNQNALGGAQGNVRDDEDLGFDFSSGNKADDYLKILELGIRPGPNVAYWGWVIDDTVLPGDTPYGTSITAGVNPYPYGRASAEWGSGLLYYALPKTPFPVVAYHNKVVPFIVANGTAIPQNSTSVALGGVYAQVGQ